MNAALKLVTPVKKVRKPRAKKANLKDFAKTAISVPGIIGAAGGCAFGASIPFMAHAMSVSAKGNFGWNVETIVIAGCLAYSAPTVHAFMNEVCSTAEIKDSDGIVTRPAKGAWLKSAGFVLCLEAVLVASPVAWCATLSMGLLMALNALVLGCKVGAWAKAKFGQ